MPRLTPASCKIASSLMRTFPETCAARTVNTVPRMTSPTASATSRKISTLRST